MRGPAPIRFREGPRRGHVEIAKEFEFLTPLFGGGVYLDESKRHHRAPDKITPVRGSSLRGQLRFWWRAVHGAGLPSLEEMRRREAEVWGSAAGSGGGPGIPLAVETVKKFGLKPVPVFIVKEGRLRTADRMRGIDYGAFPLRPEQQAANGTPGDLTEVSGSFRLRLTVPSDAVEEIRRAVEAWLLFGGLGGRTRRGFGAVTGLPPEPADPLRFLADLPFREGLPGVPSLLGSSAAAIRCRKDTGLAAQATALERLQEFRQKAGVGRNPPAREKVPSGRSRWPEPDAIRRRVGKHSPGHAPTHPVEKFPRAAFGMPIIFHFKDGKAGDPGDATLKPRDFERLASPLILRPFRGEGGKFDSLAVVLQGTREGLEHLVLDKLHVSGVVTPAEAAAAPHLRNCLVDPLAAFLAYFPNGELP